MNTETFFLINRPKTRFQGLTGETERFVVVICSRSNEAWKISVSTGWIPYSDGGSYSPREMLDWGYRYTFEEQCKELGCSWFVDLVRRMARGEEVSIEDLEVTYRNAYPTGDLPRGTLSSLRKIWCKWAARKPDVADKMLQDQPSQPFRFDVQQ